MKKILALMLALVMLLSLAACAGKTETDQAQSEAPAAEETKTETAPAAEETAEESQAEASDESFDYSDVTIGIVVFSSTAQSSQKQVAAAKQACEEYGASCIDLYAEGDKEEMLNCISQLIEADVDAIIMQPVSLPGQGILEEIKAAGILCCIFDQPLEGAGFEDTGLVISNWTSNNRMAGELAAADMLKRADGKTVNCLVMNDPTGSSAGVSRCEGFIDAINANDSLVLLEENATLKDDIAQELALAESWVEKYDDIGGFFCFHDNGAIAMVQALKAAGRLGETYVYGVDGNAEALESIKIGELTGTVVQQSGLMAYNSCIDVFNTLAGKELGHDFISYIDVILVTAENVDDYL